MQQARRCIQAGTLHRVKGADHVPESIQNIWEVLPGAVGGPRHETSVTVDMVTN